MELSRFILISLIIHAAFFLSLAAVPEYPKKGSMKVAMLKLVPTIPKERPAAKKEKVTNKAAPRHEDKGQQVKAEPVSRPPEKRELKFVPQAPQVDLPVLSPDSYWEAVEEQARKLEKKELEVIPRVGPTSVPLEPRFALDLAPAPPTVEKNVIPKESEPPVGAVAKGERQDLEQKRAEGLNSVGRRHGDESLTPKGPWDEKKELASQPERRGLIPARLVKTPSPSSMGSDAEVKGSVSIALGTGGQPGEPRGKGGVASGGEKVAQSYPASGAASERFAEGRSSSRPGYGPGGLDGGNHSVVGNGGTGQTGPGKAMASLVPGPDYSSWLKAIRDKIEGAKVYPRMARRQGLEGKTTLRFRVTSQGQVEKIEIVESSGFSLLDDAAISAVRRAAPFPYVSGWLVLPILFKLNM